MSQMWQVRSVRIDTYVLVRACACACACVRVLIFLVTVTGVATLSAMTVWFSLLCYIISLLRYSNVKKTVSLFLRKRIQV